MKLQILVPRHNEPESMMKNLLDSISLQQGINLSEIGVIIGDDGSDNLLSQDFINSYNYKIEYYTAPHKGVSAARNLCLKVATADYVMFCDADDMFFDMMGIYIIFSNIEKYHFDTLITTFSEENVDVNDKVIFINKSNDGTFIHGKVYRREYLKENDIWWKEELTINEDSYFNLLSQNCAKNSITYSKPFYLWKNNRNSVCRKDKDYQLKTFTTMIDSNDYLIEDLLKRNKNEKIYSHAASLTLLTYKTLMGDRWLEEENKHYREITENRFKKWWDKYKDYWEKCPDKIKEDIWNAMNQNTTSIKITINNFKYTVNDWLKHIETLEIK